MSGGGTGDVARGLSEINRGVAERQDQNCIQIHHSNAHSIIRLIEWHVSTRSQHYSALQWRQNEVQTPTPAPIKAE